MTRKMGVRWHLREVMATRGMFSTTDLIAPLAERGVELSREQVYRLVTQQPERLNVYTLAALCDVLDCGVGDLLEPVVERSQQRKAAGSPEERATRKVREGLRPVRARIVDPGQAERRVSRVAEAPAGRAGSRERAIGRAVDAVVAAVPQLDRTLARAAILRVTSRTAFAEHDHGISGSSVRRR